MSQSITTIHKQPYWVLSGFIAILIIMLTTTSISLTSLSGINQRLEHLVKKHNVKLEYMETMRGLIRERMLNVFTALSLEDSFKIEEEWETFSHRAREFILTREKLYKLDVTPEEKERIEIQRRVLAEGQEVMAQVFDLIREGNYNQARNDIFNALKVNDAIIAELTLMIKVGHDVSRKELSQATDNYLKTRRNVFILDVIAVLVCLLIAVVVFRNLRVNQQNITEAVSALKQANEKLEARVLERTQDLLTLRDEAVNANKAKSRFLANMSHELRTPLNAIIGYSDILIEDAEDNNLVQECQDLHKILAAGKHLLDLIDDILDISRIETGNLDVDLETFAFKPLILEAIDIMHPLFDQRNNHFSFEYDESISNVYADPRRMRQILFNLLSNANKFTEQGQISLRVKQQLIDESKWLRCEIQDTGIGISQEDQNKLFQAFMQVDASATRKYGGTGLGLAISLRFCQMMGGTIELQSELGKGSTVTVLLPLNVEKK
jgi:signal transduction histidine kinase